MKAFVISGKHDVYFDERPAPTLENSHSVLVKVQSCGICGTDIHIYEGQHPMAIGQKRVPGHEFAGIVTEVGSDVTAFKIGDRVVHEPISYCGSCYACRVGQGNVCKNLKVTGCNINGGWQEYYVANDVQWHKIPDWMTWEQAALVEPYTIAGQVCTRGEVKAGDVVLIHGGGPIGLMCCDTAKHFGATVIVSEIMEGRLALAKTIGADFTLNPKECDIRKEIMKITNGDGPNVVLDCAGLPKMAAEALEILSPAGRFVPVAACNFEANGIMIMAKQLKITGSRLQMGQFEPVIARFKLYAEHANIMITDVFSFAESDKAFAYNAERHPETGKVVIRFD